MLGIPISPDFAGYLPTVLLSRLMSPREKNFRGIRCSKILIEHEEIRPAQFSSEIRKGADFPDSTAADGCFSDSEATSYSGGATNRRDMSVVASCHTLNSVFWGRVRQQ